MSDVSCQQAIQAARGNQQHGESDQAAQREQASI